MITPTYNIKLIILLNENGLRRKHIFKKIVFYDEICCLLFEFEEDVFAYKVTIINQKVYFDPIDELDRSILWNRLSLKVNTGEHRLWAVGIGYNEISNEGNSLSSFKLSNDDRPLDILPFILQAGVNSIEIP